VGEILSARRCAAHWRVVTMAALLLQPASNNECLRHPTLSCWGLPAARTKSREACGHPGPDLADDTMLLFPIFIVVVLPHGGKSFISRSVSSVDPCVICSLVLNYESQSNIHTVGEIRALFWST
jgi:hypothetical protein